MKQLTTIGLIFLLLLQPLGKLWMVVSFKINQKEIAATLCVKKEVENNSCQGRCHIKKLLAEADEKEKKQAATQKEKSETLYCQQPVVLGFPNSVNQLEAQLGSAYKNNFSRSSFLKGVFHPPEYYLS